MNMLKQTGNASTAGSLAIFLIVTFFGAWLTHVITCIADEKWGFLIAGAIMFPVAIIHGIGLWFGLF